MNQTHAIHPGKHSRRRGAVILIAMLFLVIFGSLAAAMSIVARTNLRTSTTYEAVNRSLSASETGLKFASHRLDLIAANITTTSGTIDQALSDQIWPTLRDAIIADLGNDAHNLDNVQLVGQQIVLGRVAVSGQANAPTFRVTLERHPLAGEDYDAAFYQRAPYNESGGTNRFTSDGEPVSSTNTIAGWWLRVESRGEDDGFGRTIQMDYRMDKKVRFAILSRNRVMIGRNVMIRGAIGSQFTHTGYQHGHPVQIRDNFHGLDSQLDGWLDALTTYLAGYDTNGDNRVQLGDSREIAGLVNPASFDLNNDGAIDTYDFFLMKYDADGDTRVATGEFAGAPLVQDGELWKLINEAKYPAGTDFDWTNLRVKLPGGAWTDAAADMGYVDNGDDYSKIHGQLVLAATKANWESGAASGPYQEYLKGPIQPDPHEAALTFGASASDLTQFAPSDFDVSSYSNMATGDLAAQAASPTANDPNVTPTYTAPSAATRESVPYNAPYPYDYYERPVYENMVFTDVTIPRGTNALFRNCRFVGVTFVDAEANNTDANFNYAGAMDANGDASYANISATVNGTQVSDTRPHGNNVRFDGCTFEGMVATSSPQEFTHVRNKIQFTGTTKVDLDAPSLSASQKAMFEKSTVLAPQFSVDVGTFTDPTNPDEVLTLDGTIVAGVLDIRGQARVDGSIITTFEPTPNQGPLLQGGNPAAFNTTLGYFESTAGDSEAELPTGGFGKIIINYDPSRAMPDGINGPIELRGDLETYHESTGN